MLVKCYVQTSPSLGIMKPIWLVNVQCLSALRVKFPDIHKAHFHPRSHSPTKSEPPQWRRLYHLSRNFARQPEIRWNRHLSDQRFRNQEWIWAWFQVLPTSDFLLLGDLTNHSQGIQRSPRANPSWHWIVLSARLPSRTLLTDFESALLFVGLVRGWSGPNASWRKWDVLQHWGFARYAFGVVLSSDCPGCFGDIKCLSLSSCYCVAFLVSFSFFGYLFYALAFSSSRH